MNQNNIKHLFVDDWILEMGLQYSLVQLGLQQLIYWPYETGYQDAATCMWRDERCSDGCRSLSFLPRHDNLEH